VDNNQAEAFARYVRGYALYEEIMASKGSGPAPEDWDPVYLFAGGLCSIARAAGIY